MVTGKECILKYSFPNNIGILVTSSIMGVVD